MAAQPQESPMTAFGLSLAGGIVILLAGLLVAAFGAVLTVFMGGLGEIFGLVGTFWGILIIIFASLLKSNPQQHVGLGVVIILFSIFSWLGSFGGFLIGFLLALIGGILAIIWKPYVTPTNVTMKPNPVLAPGAVRAKPGPINFCPNCGLEVEKGAKSCQACGRLL